MNQAVWGILYSPVYHLITVWTMSKMVPLRRPVRFYLLWMLAAVPVYCIPGESAYGWIRSPLTSVMWLTFVLLGAKKASLRAAVARIEQTALLRHDLRNQLQTVQTLVDRGEEARAREILTEYSALLRAQDEEVQA